MENYEFTSVMLTNTTETQKASDIRSKYNNSVRHELQCFCLPRFYKVSAALFWLGKDTGGEERVITDCKAGTDCVI